MGDNTSDNPYLNYLNNYFGGKNDENPVCREERQYALFLYNKLLRIAAESGLKDDIDKKVLTACGLTEEDKILSVYYEVAFMRDFYKRGRDELKTDLSFNKKLYDYVLIFGFSKTMFKLNKFFIFFNRIEIKLFIVWRIFL